MIQILLVEPDPLVSRLLARVLRPYHERELVTSHCAVSVEAAHERIKNAGIPSLLITELNVGTCTSEDLIAGLIFTGFPPENVLLMAGKQEQVEALVTFGVQVVEKPISLDTFRAFLNAHIAALTGERTHTDD